MRNLVILKLGGSVLTFKETPFKANFDNIRRLSKEISEAYFNGEFKLILVHGAGSFGHPMVLESKIHLGIKTESQLASFAKVQSMQNFWNFLVTTSLQDEGLPAIPCQPSSFSIVERGKIVWMPIKAVKSFIKLGLIPVLYGVPAYDRVQGCSILSGDEITAYLAKKLKPLRVIHGTNVDGVFTEDPRRNKDAKLIRLVDSKNFEKILSTLSKSTGLDATGGMFWKVSRLIEVAKSGVECLIVNACKPGLIKKTLLGEDVVGTKIKFNNNV